MEQISIEPLQAYNLPQVAVLTARAFSTNPLAMAVYREQSDKEYRMEATFRLLLEHKPGQVFIVKNDEQVVGMLRFIEWPNCQTSFTQTLINLPIMLVGLRGMAIRRLKIQYSWLKHHPSEPHWHLGPIAVVPEMQRHGIGSKLLEQFCRYVDESGKAAYLETDRVENVRLYERFGFSVTEEELLLDTRNWFMWRPPYGDVPKRDG